jgi:hypothetical protein
LNELSRGMPDKKTPNRSCGLDISPWGKPPNVEGITTPTLTCLDHRMQWVQFGCRAPIAARHIMEMREFYELSDG